MISDIIFRNSNKLIVASFVFFLGLILFFTILLAVLVLSAWVGLNLINIHYGSPLLPYKINVLLSMFILTILPACIVVMARMTMKVLYDDRYNYTLKEIKDIR